MAKSKVWMSVVLTAALAFGTTVPATALAAESPSSAGESVVSEEDEAPAKVTDFATFMADLKVLESYADQYAKTHAGEDANELVINYIRTGVERYSSDSWNIIAGNPKKQFENFVAQQDVALGTAASDLKSIGEFQTPDGLQADFGHLFGALNIIYYSSMTTKSLNNADMGSWAGDVCDLMTVCAQDENARTALEAAHDDIETMAAYVKANCVGVDLGTEHTFDITDFRGDLDAFYLMDSLKSGKKLSSTMQSYYNAYLTDAARSVLFAKNRFAGSSTRDDIRWAIENAYNNSSATITLEQSRQSEFAEFGYEGDLTTLRTACCYAFADYLYDLTGVITDLASNDVYEAFSSETTTLAPGVIQQVKEATAQDGSRLAYYLATVDIARDDVMVQANFKDNAPTSEWGMQRVTDQMAAAKARHSDPSSESYVANYTPVVGVNADFYNMTTGAPSGALVMEGVKYHEAGGENFFGILKDGTPVIGGTQEWNACKNDIQEAVGGSILLVKNGEEVGSSSASYYENRASRTCVGITADGKVVLMVLDGRQEPVSAGGTAQEMAQIMLDAGCVNALCLDGGGSSVFAAKAEGSDEVKVVSRPSDGYERSVSSSLMVVSTARPSDEFDHALVSADYDYVTPGTSLALSVTGVSASGGAADVPEGAVLQLSDDTVGTLEGNVFTASALGSVEVQLVYEGTVIGTKAISVVRPDKLAFSGEDINAVYGIPVDLPLTATYNNNQVAINPADVMLGFVENGEPVTESESGVIKNFTFTGNEESGVRVVTIGAALLDDSGAPDLSSAVMLRVFLYKGSEAIFDFDSVTGGDRTLAWKREVSNATDDGSSVYTVVVPNQPMAASYTFALDMTQIPIPDRLKPLVALLPGGDSSDATAWNFLLQLAERVSVLTNVEVVLNVDPNFDVDYSNLTVVSEYFQISGEPQFDEATSTLTLRLSWIDQTQPIDPTTANPLCVLSGIVMTPKADAAWSSDNRLDAVQAGSLTYDIYLRSSTLYSIASNQSMQEQYGIYPFKNPDVLVNGQPESGGHFENLFKEFEDRYTLDNTAKNGWVRNAEGRWMYYENNVALTGIHQLPSNDGDGKAYYYDLGEDGILIGKVSGLMQLDGKTFFAKNGELQSGWQTVVSSDGDVQNYYFDPVSKVAVDGEQTISTYHYLFENCVLVRGDLVTRPNGDIWYMWAGSWASQQWMTIDGNEYYFRSSYAAATGLYAFNLGGVNQHYVFSDSGVWQKDLNGFYDLGGKTYLVENGVAVAHPGLVEYEGDYYYFPYDNPPDAMVKGRICWVEDTNGLLPNGNYVFDAQGKMVRNGVAVLSEGTCWVSNDKIVKDAGLVRVVSDEGEVSYYYFDPENNGWAVKDYLPANGPGFWVEKTNDLLPQWGYYFDENGVIVHDADTSKNGIAEDDASGALCYFIDGVKAHMGMFKDGDDYYYAKGTGHLVVDATYYCTITNGLMPEGPYTFDEHGKMVLPDTSKNGIVAEDGSLYYYVSGERTYAGVIQIDGSYYYVKTSGEVVHGKSYWISKTNGLVPERSYVFDESGAMDVSAVFATQTAQAENAADSAVEAESAKDVTVAETEGAAEEATGETETLGASVENGIVSAEDGTLFYYVDGEKAYDAGLVQLFFDEDDQQLPADKAKEAKTVRYYYVDENACVATDSTVYVEKTNGILPEQEYVFGKDGAMVQDGLDEQAEHGDGLVLSFATEDSVWCNVVRADGKLRLFSDGEQVERAGVWVSKDKAFFVSDSADHVLATGLVSVEEPLLNDANFAAGSYRFDDLTGLKL